jgi:hypothetical protein
MYTHPMINFGAGPQMFTRTSLPEVDGETCPRAPLQPDPLDAQLDVIERDLARTLAGTPARRIIEIDVAVGEP